MSRTVLVVDDEAPLLRLMTRLVEKAGRPALAAATGAEAALKRAATSSRRMRPLRPLPLIADRSTPSCRAKARTDGEA